MEGNLLEFSIWLDDKGPDEKVMYQFQILSGIHNDLSDVNAHLVKRNRALFKCTKICETKLVEVGGWGDVNEAHDIKNAQTVSTKLKNKTSWIII
jgi:inorganic pyrophosphatase